MPHSAIGQRSGDPCGRSGLETFLTIRPPGSTSQQLWMLFHELPDLFVLALTQTELGCRDRLFHLAGMT